MNSVEADILIPSESDLQERRIELARVAFGPVFSVDNSLSSPPLPAAEYSEEFYQQASNRIRATVEKKMSERHACN